MLRDEFIEEKVRALQAEIDVWTKENGVISGKETIHVSLIVKQNTKITKYNRTHLYVKGKRVKLVDSLITAEEWERILSLWKPKEWDRKEAVEFFKNNGNAPTSLREYEKAIHGGVGWTLFKNIDTVLRNADSGFRMKEWPGWRKGVPYEDTPHKILRVVLPT